MNIVSLFTWQVIRRFNYKYCELFTWQVICRFNYEHCEFIYLAGHL